jgi:hypothetical protein
MKAKFITADGISEFRNIQYRAPSYYLPVWRKLKIHSLNSCPTIEADSFETRLYRLQHYDSDKCLVYKEDPK